MITLTFVADTPEELKRDVLFFTQHKIAEVPGSATVEEKRSYTASAEFHPDSEPAPDPKPEPEPEKVTEPEADGPISESEAVELRVLCEKFCAADKEGKKKIKEFLTTHKVSRITALPKSMLDEFKKAVAI